MTATALDGPVGAEEDKGDEDAGCEEREGGGAEEGRLREEWIMRRRRRGSALRDGVRRGRLVTETVGRKAARMANRSGSWVGAHCARKSLEPGGKDWS